MNNIDLEQFIIGLSKVYLQSPLGKVKLKDAVNFALHSQNLQVDDDFKLTVLQDEPKFKVGDYVVYCNEDVDLITGIEENGYRINNSGYIPFVCESDIRLWTIEDAKDGDVLAVEAIEEKYQYPFVAIYKERGLDFFNSYCSIGFDGKFYKGEAGHSTEKVHPANKIQRAILFSKMHDAGYEWDAGNKELIKKPLDDIELIMYDYLSSDTCGKLPKERMREIAINRARDIREKLK